ncbi:CheR family methyltransferase [Methylobacterium radiotolerans]|uniref:MCP methyltransferase, CheR-type n=1 Tax=Methylobacterium radiotolerans (strain ATCC 27329 / DSM 1819 / JCM 2831 / NBRC 15690 / NCIMB 10815 / 0-1) TaxID=426355 RepID=B1M1S1_METRJ|nr:CheR family methyltransferase [Methylobacterium radiotolerans]ACB27654.1 MCP methyltransferase, CheR-type [Methylobacterium radiotolerans JCM 2831]
MLGPVARRGIDPRAKNAVIDQDHFPIVGIGASAGGIEAMRGFFRGVPERLEAAFVVVTHLGREHKSLLPDVLARLTPLKVEAAADGVPVGPGTVYVMPSGFVMGIAGGRLTLTPLGEGRETKPIDIFLTALALDQGERAVGVILSGGDGDGAIGIKAIKEHGGLTLAQTADGYGPETADMPLSSLRTGFVDFGETAERMGDRIAAHVAAAPIAPDAQADGVAREFEAELLTEIFAILRRQVGHDFSGYKPSTFGRRLQRRIGVVGASGLDGYLKLLRADPAEVGVLFRDLLIGVTNFFRDTAAFEALTAQVIPKLFDARAATDVIRIWVPACSTGEEVYSLAILLREHMVTLADPPRVQIFATDIDERALTVARTGRYPTAYLSAVSPERIGQHFVVEGDSAVVEKAVRDLCTFAPHNVLRDPPFSRLDLVSCRNLMIYLGVEAQQQLMPVLHYALRPRGYLFIGMAENVTRFEDLFETIDKQHRIFQARDAIPPARLRPMSGTDTPILANAGHPQRRNVTTHAALRHAVETQMLSEFTPPHAVVTRTGEAVHYSSRIGDHLEVVPGQPTRELAAMARKGLRLDLRTALREAIEGNILVVREGIGVELPDGRFQSISLVVKPLNTPGAVEPLFLVVFNEAAAPVERERQQALKANERDTALQGLERELSVTRERLQAVIEEYETSLEELKSSNEELYSVNEEMQAANEELEASKEETQSLNEELQTMNSELASKIEAVDQLTDDQATLFEGMNIASVLLTPDLHIRMFTNAAAQIFGLQPSDVGRSLRNFSAPIPLAWLVDEIPTVLAANRPSERTIEGADGARYRVRLMASSRKGGRRPGIVANFTNLLEQE